MLKNTLLSFQATESTDASLELEGHVEEATVDRASVSGIEHPQPRLLRAKQFIKDNEKKMSQVGEEEEEEKKKERVNEDDLASKEKRLYIQCHICNKKIKRKYHFRRHLKTHRNEKEHQCPICHYKSVRKDNLKSHMKTHQKHIDLVTNYQKEAGKLFLNGQDTASFSVSDEQKHSAAGEEMKKANLSDPESIIPLLLSSEDFVKRCLKTWYGNFVEDEVEEDKSSEVGSEDSVSAIVASQKRSLQSLDQSYKKQRVAQEVLDNKLRDMLSPNQQQERNTEYSSPAPKNVQYLADVKRKKAIQPKLYKERLCRLCNYKTFDHKAFQEHVNTKHKEGMFYKCNECGYKGKNVSKMVEHIRTHTGERPFKCDQCNYAAKRKDNLAQHKTVRHDKYKSTDPIFSHFMNGVSAFTPVHSGKQPRPHVPYAAEPLSYMMENQYVSGGYPSVFLRPEQLVTTSFDTTTFHDSNKMSLPVHHHYGYGN